MRVIKGFTLAEILVTLGVIGVVASMTVPTLVQDIQDTQLKTAYRKAYADAIQAIYLLKTENTLPTVSSSMDAAGFFNIFNQFKTKFNIIKDCNSNNTTECFTRSGELWRDSNPLADSPAFLDSSGRSWSLRGNETSTSLYSGFMLVDINGNKKPNKYGKDRFPLVFSNGDQPNTSIVTLNRYNPVTTGEIITVIPYTDMNTNVDNICPGPPCYYSSWLHE